MDFTIADSVVVVVSVFYEREKIVRFTGESVVIDA